MIYIVMEIYFQTFVEQKHLDSPKRYYHAPNQTVHIWQLINCTYFVGLLTFSSVEPCSNKYLWRPWLLCRSGWIWWDTVQSTLSTSRLIFSPKIPANLVFLAGEWQDFPPFRLGLWRETCKFHRQFIILYLSCFDQLKFTLSHLFVSTFLTSTT